MIKLAEKTPKDNQADVLNYALESLGIITRQNLRQNKLFLKVSRLRNHGNRSNFLVFWNQCDSRFHSDKLSLLVPAQPAVL